MKKEAEMLLKYRPFNRNRVYVECKHKINTSKNRGNEVIYKISEQHNGKARNRGNRDSSHTGQHAHMSEGTNV